MSLTVLDPTDLGSTFAAAFAVYTAMLAHVLSEHHRMMLYTTAAADAAIPNDVPVAVCACGEWNAADYYLEEEAAEAGWATHLVAAMTAAVQPLLDTMTAQEEETLQMPILPIDEAL